MFEIKILSETQRSFADETQENIDYLILDNYTIVFKTNIEYNEAELNLISRKIKAKKLLICYFSKKKEEFLYIILGFNLFANVVNKPANKLKTEELIRKLLTNNSDLEKLLKLEFKYFKSIDSSLNIQNFVDLAFVHQIILVVLRKFQKVSGEYNEVINVDTSVLFDNLENWVISNLHLPTPTVEEMAKKVNMSPSKFKLVFNQIYSCTPHQYFLNLKLKRACNTLHFTNLSVSEVSHKLGFNHPSGFSRFIKTKLGLSPLEFNEKMKY
jgi:AraC-like DNA-binding protein